MKALLMRGVTFFNIFLFFSFMVLFTSLSWADSKVELSDMSYEELYVKFTNGKKVVKDAKNIIVDAPIEVAEGDYNDISITINFPYDKSTYISKITVLTTKNKINFVASANFTFETGAGYLRTRTKLAESQDVVFLCETNDGTVFEKRKFISIFYFSCTDQFLKKDCKPWKLEEKNAAIRVWSKNYKIDDIVKVNTSIIHPAASGFEIDDCSGKVGARIYIKNATLYFNDIKIASFQYGAAQINNSLITFPLKATKNGRLKIIWENNNGEKFQREGEVNPLF